MNYQERKRSMNHRQHCIYCGAETYKGGAICPYCLEKQQLIRKIRRIVFHIKYLAEQEAGHVQG